MRRIILFFAVISFSLSAPIWAKTTDHPTSQDASSQISADTAAQLLRDGNKRFIDDQGKKKSLGTDTRKALTKGQHPHTIVLSCADSRVPPEYVFDQGLGDLFVVRAAGEALDSSVIASIEYAVEHVGSHLLVVMGHTQCGAISAALDTKPGSSAGSASLDRLVQDIQPRLKGINRSEDLASESGANADLIVQDLLSRSPIIKHKVESGDLQIRSALYHLDSGVIDFRKSAGLTTTAKH